MAYRFFFAAGPGDIIVAHRSAVSDQMSVTFSSEFEGFCAANSATALMVSSHSRADLFQSGNLTLENRPKRAAGGWKYHAEEIRYGLNLALSAKRFKATHAFVQSGSTHYFVMALFRLFGIKVIPIMHNTLWPAGFPKASLLKRAIRWADGVFFRRFASAVLVVSPECGRQVDVLTAGHSPPIRTFTIQFSPNQFKPTPPPALAGPLVVTFAGRITENKGALDVVEIARLVSEKVECVFHICGDGPDLSRTIDLVARYQLDRIVHVHGWTSPPDLRKIIAASHLAIVPTRSDFNEGMAMTAIEPILLGRPVITSAVVPASEVLASACVLCATDDVRSFADALVALASDHDRYGRLCDACLPLSGQFFDPAKSSQAAMQWALSKA